MTGDPREAETTRAAIGAVPNVAGWSNTGNLSGLGGWGVGAIQWVGPQIHTVEAKLSGEGGQDVFAQMGRVRPAKFIPRTDDIGGPKWGRPSSQALILAKAEQELQRGDPGMKREEYAETLSKWLARHRPDEPARAASTILKDKTFSALWRRFVVQPRRRRPRRP
jgi:hypothetical protein